MLVNSILGLLKTEYGMFRGRTGGGEREYRGGLGKRKFWEMEGQGDEKGQSPVKSCCSVHSALHLISSLSSHWTQFLIHVLGEDSLFCCWCVCEDGGERWRVAASIRSGITGGHEWGVCGVWGLAPGKPCVSGPVTGENHLQLCVCVAGRDRGPEAGCLRSSTGGILECVCVCVCVRLSVYPEHTHSATLFLNMGAWQPVICWVTGFGSS